jgi:hypothetical protein
VSHDTIFVSVETMSVNNQYSCSICEKQISDTYVIFCDFCKHWVHRKCNELSLSDYNLLAKTKDTLPWSCLKCNCDLFPFCDISIDQNPTVLPALTSKTLKSKEVSDFFAKINSASFPDDTLDEQDFSTKINCRYYNIHEFKSLSTSERFFSFLHLNISSISKHFDNFQIFLHSLEHHFKVIAISESRIVKSLSQVNFDIEGYHFYSTPTEARAGGTMLFISNTISSIPRNDLNELVYRSKLLESTFAEICLPKQSNLIVGSIYKHPSLLISEFDQHYLSPLLDKISKENKTIILLGDFNINLLNTISDENISNFLDSLGNHLILPQITLPTRVTPSSKTLIDNIFTSPIKFEKVSGNLTTGISDHLPQFLLIKKSFKSSSQESFSRDWKNFDQEHFLLDFMSTDWHQILDVTRGNPDLSFDSFFDKLSGLLDTHVPSRKLTRKQAKFKQKPWVTSAIKKSMYKRDKILQKFLKAKDATVKINLHSQYKTYRNSIVNLIRVSKQNYFSHYFLQNSKNSRMIWKGVNEYLNNKKQNKVNNISLKINNETISDPAKTVNIFNNFFTSIADDIRKNIPKALNDYKKYLKNPLQNSFYFHPVTIIEMINTIKSIKPNKSCGPYSIPFDILNLLLFDIATILTKIINLTFETGVFPSSLKLVKVIPIFKNKGSSLQFNNYRPISLLSNIDKIFEKLVHSRLISFLDKYKVLYNKQFGFRKHHSTAHTLISLTEEIRKSLDSGRFSCGVFIDLQKAFDTVDHMILLDKLNKYGVRGLANSWFKSYLSNRKQFVSILGIKSEIKAIKHGVPQGSVLGPLLFILYINDLYTAISKSSTFLFADDTCLLYSHSNLKTIQKNLNYDLRSLFRWLCASKISLNATKTEVVLFHHERKPVEYDIKLKLNGKLLVINKEVKYLGLIIDHNLSFSNHLSTLSNKLRKANGAISKIRHVATESVLRSVFNSLFISHLSYASQTWAQNINLNTSRIFKLQKTAARLMTFSDFHAHSKPLFYQLRFLNISDLVKFCNLLLTHQSLNGKCPSDITNILNQNYYNGSHNTRCRTFRLLTKLNCKTTKYGLNSVSFQSILHWNELQSHFKNYDLASVSFSKFYHNVFNFLLEKYVS